MPPHGGINKSNSSLAKLYPVGSIYISVNDTNPGTFIGGTWERIKDRFLLAAGDTYAAGSTGGEAEHTLTTDEMPTHAHAINDWPLWWESSESPGSPWENPWNKTGNVKTGVGNTLMTDKNGGGQPHNNMPPYLSVFMWKRVA